MIKWKDEYDKLYQLIVVENKTYVHIGKLYGVSYNAVKKAAKRLGIPLKPRRAINPNETFGLGTAKTAICLHCGKEFVKYKSHTGKYCCNQCQSDHQYEEYIRKWKNGEAPKLKHEFFAIRNCQEWFLRLRHPLFRANFCVYYIFS